MEELEIWQAEILEELKFDLSNALLAEPAPKYSTSKKYQDNILLRLTFEFALNSIKFTKLVKRDGYDDLARQLFRSATSIGANSKEAQNAESKADFIHKLKIALKEADESEYWLFLCDNLDDCASPTQLIEQLTSIIKILTKIISTSKTRKPTIS
jgi:four helix bundle protein